jgi:1-acyl-sn-glycerol-3-phosphate acyltransferase
MKLPEKTSIFSESEKSKLDPRHGKVYYLHVTTTRRILTHLLRSFFSVFGRIEATGGENLPLEGPVVLASNHLTNFDVFPMQFALPRPIYFMGKAELFKNPLLDSILRRLGGFPVFRGGRDEWAMNYALQVLKRDQILGIFPEGSRSKGKGLRPAKTGAARLALEAQCPIVPIAIDGPQHLFKTFPRRVPIRIKIGKPILPEPFQSPLDLTDRIMFSLAEMLPAEMRGVYAEKPKGFDLD